ncbi:16S rRNA processing protein RimM [Breoghania corrubedonensis]|uniref:Ribosome maturation factor RimM n=1 Tax=Breoghania corrubedonensis TaxID=665038 RepID=A0A2T5VIJ8_9HYPH|nr:ribosome maturation factor RimM [Breoghania corrubedonensis]PTW63538.1 16S rRNA processing protein RimM [Breoghania corrubedonensis]
MASSDRVLMAEIGAAHGIRGEVRVKPHGDDPMALRDYGPLEAADGRVFEIEALRPQKHMLVVRFKGIRDRNAAEALTRTKLYLPRERLPEPDADDFYHADLVGLPVFDAQGTELGTVLSVPNFGAGDLLEIAPKGAPSFYLPFTHEAVPEIDIANRRITAVPPEGLLAGEEDAEERRREEGNGA